MRGLAAPLEWIEPCGRRVRARRRDRRGEERGPKCRL